jgi:hypothetical protein
MPPRHAHGPDAGHHRRGRRDVRRGRPPRIFERYGEEKLAGRYARAIIAARATAPIERSGQLVDILVAATPVAVQREVADPAKRVFQALRIEVNAELSVLERALPAAMGLLRVGGRIAVMSYQSLEDRLVKREFAEAAASTAPAGLPVELPEHAPRFRLLTKGAELASDEERAATPVPPRASARGRENRGGAMSIATAPARPSLTAAPHRAPETVPAPLRALERPLPRRRPRLLYGIIAVAGAVLIAAAQMGLSILTTQSSYELSALSSQQRGSTTRSRCSRTLSPASARRSTSPPTRRRWGW